MAHQLLIRLLNQTEADSDALLAEWGLIHPDLKRLMDVSVTPLTRIKPTLESKYASLLIVKTIVLVPGHQVALHSVNIPSKQSRQIRQALPFALEESLANEIEDNFFAIGPRGADGELNVAVVTHAKLKYWLGQLEKSHLNADVMLAETQLIPCVKNSQTLVVGADTSWLRSNEFQGISFANSLLETVLKSLGQDAYSRDFSIMSAGDEEARLALEKAEGYLEKMYSQPETTIQQGPGVEEKTNKRLQASDLLLETKASEGKLSRQAHLLTPLHAFAEEILSGHSRVVSQFNLLQGQYKPKGPGISLGFNWKPVAAIAAIWFFTLFIMELLSANKLNIEAHRYQAQAENIYREYFPNDKRIVDVKSQTMAHLRRAGVSGEGVSMLELLHPAGKAVHQLNVNNTQSPMKINRVAFEERLKELRLDISANKFDQLDQLKANLEQQGLSVEIGSAVAQGQGVESRIKIKRG